jgi:hypothetical protein
VCLSRELCPGEKLRQQQDYGLPGLIRRLLCWRGIGIMSDKPLLSRAQIDGLLMALSDPVSPVRIAVLRGLVCLPLDRECTELLRPVLPYVQEPEIIWTTFVPSPSMRNRILETPKVRRASRCTADGTKDGFQRSAASRRQRAILGRRSRLLAALCP